MSVAAASAPASAAAVAAPGTAGPAIVSAAAAVPHGSGAVKLAFDNKAAMGTYEVETRRRILGYDDMSVAARAAVGPATKLLSVGCGTGQELISFGSAAPNAERPVVSLVGVDPAITMLELARARVTKELPPDAAAKVELLHGTLQEVDPGAKRFAAYFDGATSVLVMQFVPDTDDAQNSKTAYLQAMATRLAPGAHLFLLDACGDTKTAAGAAELDALLKLWVDFIALKGGTQTLEQTKRITYNALKLVPEARMRELLRGAGFVDVTRVYSAFHFVGFRARYAPSNAAAAADAAAAAGTGAAT